VASQLIEGVTAHVQRDSLEDAREICADSTYFLNNRSRNAMTKAAFNKKRALLTSTLDLELRKKLVKCYIWSIALYGAETWTLRAADQKHLENFEMQCWRRMEKISWTDHVIQC